MKNIITLFLIIFSYALITAQEKVEKQIVFVGIGKPLITDINIYQSKRNYSLSINYQYRFSDSFALEGFYAYAQSNNYPSFINNSQQLDQFLKSQKQNEIYENSLWSDIYNHSLGAKIHFSFVNNKKIYFSFNLSGGMLFSKSSIFSLSSIQFNHQTGEIVNYTSEIIKDTESQIFHGLGLQFQYTLSKNYIIGIETAGYFSKQKEKNGIITIPVISNYYNASILFGKKF